MTEEPFAFTASGVNGQLTILPDRVRIGRRGVLAFVSQGVKGDKEILLDRISSIQFRAADALLNGYIQIGFMGGAESKGSLFAATGDENTIVFNVFQARDFGRAKELIEWYQVQARPTAGGNLADLEKLVELRDKGLVTAEEFTAKRTQILGLAHPGTHPPAWLEDVKRGMPDGPPKARASSDPLLAALDELAELRKRGEISVEEFAARKRGAIEEHRRKKGASS